MLKLYCFSFVIIVQATNIHKYCDFTSEDHANHCYVKETLITMAHSPHQLAVDRDTNTLFFSFDSGQGDYIPALYKIDTKKLTLLKGIKDAFSIAYDPIAKEIYFGGSHGIYRYNNQDKELKHLNIKNLDVWWLYVDSNLYFIKFPSLHAYRYENRSIKAVSELKDLAVHQIVVDVDSNKIFTNNSGLYGIKPNKNEVLRIKDGIKFLNMATDNKGHVYVCAEDGIYVVGKIIQKVKRILNMQGVLGFTFDKFNNIIYSDSHEIVRLLYISRT